MFLAESFISLDCVNMTNDQTSPNNNIMTESSVAKTLIAAPCSQFVLSLNSNLGSMFSTPTQYHQATFSIKNKVY